MVTQQEIDHLTGLLKSNIITTETKYILLDKMYDRLFAENITYTTLITPEYIREIINAFDYLDDNAGFKEKFDALEKKSAPLEKEIDEALLIKDETKYEDLISKLDEVQAERANLISTQEIEIKKAQSTIVELNGIVENKKSHFKKVQDEHKSRLKRHKWIKGLLKLGLLIISLLLAIGADRLSGGFKELFEIKKDFHLVTIIVFFALDLLVIDKIENFLTGKFDENYFNARITELSSIYIQFDKDFKNTCAATGMKEEQIFDLVNKVVSRFTN